MEWFVYVPFSVEAGSEHLETVAETAKWYSSEGLKGIHRPPSAFNRAWATAQVAAREAGWDGTCLGEPMVFWTPGGSGFAHGFAWRQADGTGVLVSPQELPHLDRSKTSPMPAQALHFSVDSS